MKIYLAGPITGCDYAGATDWREDFTVMLPEVLCLSPMRGKDYLLRETTLADNYDDKVMSTCRGIMHRDFWDVNRCDLVVANFLGAKRVSIGTCMEVAWAYQQHKPVLAIMEKIGNPHEHAMMGEAFSWRTDNISEAIEMLKAILPVT